jgi:hypothetical protein
MRGIGFLEKIPEASDFDDLFGGQHGCHKFRLRFSTYLVEMALMRRLGEKRPDACVQRALEQEVRFGPAGTLCALIPKAIFLASQLR